MRALDDQADAVGVRRTLLLLHRTTGVPIMYGGVVRHGRMRLTPPLGTSSRLLARLTVYAGRGLGGRTLLVGRPMAVKDYPYATTISHDYDEAVRDAGIRSAVAVPVVVRRTVRAVLYGARREPVPLGDRAVQAVVAAARDLEQEIVVRDEVDRQIALLERHAPRQAVGTQESALREAARRAYAELRVLATRAADGELRDRALRACAELGLSTGQPSPPGFPELPAGSLAPRELDVLACVALGSTNAEIAGALGVAAGTVKSYLRSAMRKLRAHTRTQAVFAARRAGLLP